MSHEQQTLQKNPLGSTGLTVSCLGLGTVKIGRNEGVKYPAGFELPDDQQVRQILHLTRELGINLIDTAPAYGSSEERLGTLLTQRHEWVICSKVGEEFADGKSFFDFSGKHVRRSIERSLKRLRTDYLDIVLVHSDGNDEDIIRSTDCLDVLNRCKEEGLLRSFGLSTKTVAGGLLAVQQSDVVMVTYNPTATADDEVIDLAHAQNKGVLIKKAFNSGHSMAESSAANDPVKANLEFIFARAGVSSVIVGTINPVHLRQNVEAAIAATRRTHTGCRDSSDR
ncbi:MAG: aldo/keto reductase [Gammaproteobacteria bacterium]|nr:aldo/keto reductase [Gammaproteobacteria bacterium]